MLTGFSFLAEREGFEPPVPFSTTVFKTAAFDHSAISPKLLREKRSFSKAMQRYDFIFILQYFDAFFSKKILPTHKKLDNTYHIF